MAKGDAEAYSPVESHKLNVQYCGDESGADRAASRPKKAVPPRLRAELASSCRDAERLPCASLVDARRHMLGRSEGRDSDVFGERSESCNVVFGRGGCPAVLLRDRESCVELK